MSSTLSTWSSIGSLVACAFLAMHPVRALFRSVGIDIRRRRPDNRFDAMEDTLAHLARSQYFQPRSVIDVGAHTGEWTRLALKYFPRAQYYLIEPQAECQSALHQLAHRYPSIAIKRFAVTSPQVEKVQMLGTGSTGAFVLSESRDDAVTTPSCTLDSLISITLSPAYDALLKFDIQGHELAAIAGAEYVLASVSVVICETMFFGLATGEPRQLPTFADLFDAFRQRDFVLYDVVSLSGRRRDNRLVQGDCVFVKQGHPLLADCRWE